MRVLKTKWVSRFVRRGQGRSGGYRMIVAYRVKELAVFLYGFAKSGRNNIECDDLATAREIAKVWLTADRKRIERAIAEDEIQEIGHEEEET
jgi:hypothetical protein